MQVENPQLGFPNTFCCNCGATDCKTEDQDTRVTRFFSIGRTDTIFRLSVPTCATCRRTLRRRTTTRCGATAIVSGTTPDRSPSQLPRLRRSPPHFCSERRLIHAAAKINPDFRLIGVSKLDL